MKKRTCKESILPNFRPFVGTCYNLELIENFSAVVAPPYDVINKEERSRLASLHPYNAVSLILPQSRDSRSSADVAADLLCDWLQSKILIDDAIPAFYLYRMGFRDESGRMRQTTGVIGALSLNDPDQIRPHEETMSKPIGEQLALLEATRTNLSPIYLLSTASNISPLFDTVTPPDYKCTDPEGTHHRIWRITSPAILDAISAAISASQLVIADGHHRYETACRFAQESNEPGAQWIMALVVELADDELWIRPTHRLFLDADPDAVAAAFHTTFPGSTGITASILDIQSALSVGRAVLLGQGAPAPALAARPWAPSDMDANKLLHSLPVTRVHHELLPLLAAEGRIEFEPDLTNVVSSVESGYATAAIALPPVTVDTIRRIAFEGLKMPKKTTYFSPKPRTGAVFRRLDADNPND